MIGGSFKRSLVQIAFCSVALLTFSHISDAQPAPKTEEEIRIDRAINAGLEYLASAQQPSGGWVVDQFHGETTSATSLAIMAFMSAGHVPGEGPYSKHMEKGLRFVIESQKPNGLIIHKTGHGPMYCHGISTLMLAEIVGMTDETQSAGCRVALEKGVRLILESQQVFESRRESGGWRYQPNSQDSDLSVTGWQLMALRAAKNVGCDVPSDNIDRAVAYVKSCGDSRGGFGYQPRNGSTPVLTGTALSALQVCGEYESDEVKIAAKYLQQRMPKYDQAWFFYGLYYVSVGMYQVGGDSWKQTKSWMLTDLLPRQEKDGSWVPQNGNERALGKTYPTAMAILALAVDYGYLPIYQR